MKQKRTWKAWATLLLLGASLPTWAQIFTTPYNFTNTPGGANPLRLTLANGLLFGSTAFGGTNGNGTVFTFDTNSSVLTTIYNFTGANNSGSEPNNVLAGGNKIYGTTLVGGTNSYGMVYAVGTNGSGFVSLYSFDGYPDGENPRSGLVMSGGVLYGTTYLGGTGTGASGVGTVFKINIDGTGYATLHSFTNTPDGAEPQSEPVLGGNTLYGTTTGGGTNGKGTIFAINTNGTGYTVLYSFTNTPGPIYPIGGLVLSAGVLYGTGSGGGNNANGAIFAINTDGSGFRVLHSFSGSTDGTTPKATLTLTGSYLYGTTVSGGSGSGGTIFLINTNGAGFAVLGSFTNNAASGSDLLGGVIQAGNGMWGTAYQGGISNVGTLFLLPLSASAPTILSFTFNPTNGSTSFEVANAAGSTNRLWASTNLTSANFWQVIATNVMNASGLWFFTDTNAAKINNARFYRFSTP